jgi:hypothetical protein
MWFFFLAGHKKHYLISTFGNGPCWRQKKISFCPTARPAKNSTLKIKEKENLAQTLVFRHITH